MELEIPGAPGACSYLPGQTAHMVYRIAYGLKTPRYEHLLERGWRRFGRTLFRPSCPSCCACRSLRVGIREFRPSKSQRRCLNANRQLELVIGQPTVTREHLVLYNRYHADMHQRRGWAFREIDEANYSESFLDGKFPFSREFQYRLNGELVGLGIVDVTPAVMSSVYFFHDPDLRSRGLGTFSLLNELLDGSTAGRKWLYLGYYIRDCQSMNYKNHFRPHQVLETYCSDAETPDWRWATDPDSQGSNPA
jgi:arginine-tRNA-protein transferase